MSSFEQVGPACGDVCGGVGTLAEPQARRLKRAVLSSDVARCTVGHDTRTDARWLRVPIVLVTLTVVTLSGQLRWSLATSLPWQCDELPLLVRFTGLCGHATNEVEARAFEPSFYTFRMGAIRSVHVPNYYVALHTTTGFWANLGLHLFGYGTASGRAGSLFWSTIAVLAAAWAGWLATRSISGVCLSALFVSLAPMTTAYGAQARGYAEAIALTLLLLIALDYLRRAPTSWFRAIAVFLAAFQLSLTVYTMWVYFVLPTLAASVWLLPRTITDPQQRRSARCILGVIFLALCSAMALYTAERWTQLIGASRLFGERVDSFGAATSFIARWLNQVMPIAWIGVPLAVCGLFVLRRSSLRWWLWSLMLALIVPVSFAAGKGSPGYVRNFAYWVGPLSVLAACGGDGLIRWLVARAKPVVVYALVAITLAGGGGFTYAGLERRARAVLLPDWGALVQALHAEPERRGPRFVCPGLANHWQIEWYDESDQTQRLLGVPQGGTIEVVFGAQYNESGRLVVYRRDPNHRGIPERDMPAFLSVIPPTSVRFGIEVRRFVGQEFDPTAAKRHAPYPLVGSDPRALTRAINPGSTPVQTPKKRFAKKIHALSPDTPVFVLCRLASKPSVDQWAALLSSSAVRASGLVEFAAQSTPTELVQTLIAPAREVPALYDLLPKALGAVPKSIRFFALSPLP